MNYAGKLYSGDVYIGIVNANSMRGLTWRASMLCNRYNKPVDTMILHKAAGQEVNELRFTRHNKLSPNNQIIRGQWQ